MQHTILLVQTNPVRGRGLEYNDWYSKQHLPDILAIPGWTAAQRFRLSNVQSRDMPAYPFRYLAIYEMVGDERTALDEMARAVPGLVISDALADQRKAHVFQPIVVGPSLRSRAV